MSNTSRMRTIFRSKTTRAMDRMEDPRETLDDSYDQQVKLLQQIRQAVAEVATAKKRIELQGQEMGARYARLASQAQEALDHGREDLARAALERRALLESQVAKLQQQYSTLQKQTEQLQERERRLTDQIAAFRIEKETIKATYTASEAQVRANEAVAGIGSYLTEVGTSLDRARDRVAQMQARAAATDELLSSGVLKDLTAAPDADIERQLAAMSAKAEVDRQLRAMKGGDAATGRVGSESKGESKGDEPDEWLGIGQGPSTPSGPQG
jgi:phage shock protein A